MRYHQIRKDFEPGPSIRRLRNVSSNEKQRMLMLISPLSFPFSQKGRERIICICHRTWPAGACLQHELTLVLNEIGFLVGCFRLYNQGHEH